MSAASVKSSSFSRRARRAVERGGVLWTMHYAAHALKPDALAGLARREQGLPHLLLALPERLVGVGAVTKRVGFGKAKKRGDGGGTVGGDDVDREIGDVAIAEAGGIDLLALRRPFAREQVCQSLARHDQRVAALRLYPPRIQSDLPATVARDRLCFTPEAFQPGLVLSRNAFPHPGEHQRHQEELDQAGNGDDLSEVLTPVEGALHGQHAEPDQDRSEQAMPRDEPEPGPRRIVPGGVLSFGREIGPVVIHRSRPPVPRRSSPRRRHQPPAVPPVRDSPRRPRWRAPRRPAPWLRRTRYRRS